MRIGATIGRTTWSTSILPEAAGGCHLLPVTKAVRVAETLEDGNAVQIELEVLE